MKTFAVNQRTYRLPDRPVAVVCIDGSDNTYLDAAMDRGAMPNLQKMAVQGYRGMARSALPSFTNVNNVSLVTGAPPVVHGICGNYFYDEISGQEVMMNSPEYLCAPTILEKAANAGRKVAMITAKDKLRLLLSKNLHGIAFSAERPFSDEKLLAAMPATRDFLKCGPPDIYSAEASLYVLRAGVALLQDRAADFLYLSLTDFMQHSYEPTQREVLDFYRKMDLEFGRLAVTDAILGLTADHGMNAKHDAEGNPKVLYLEEALEREFGPGFRVILPITDPYVRHHGALGSFAVVYLPEKERLGEVASWLYDQNGVTEVLEKTRAAKKLELPADRMGDLVVMSGRDTVLGKSPKHHDLTQLHSPLRSHGGRYEEMVPLIVSRPLNQTYQAQAQGDLRNFDVFDFVLNGTL